jgi:hypothetical protein
VEPLPFSITLRSALAAALILAGAGPCSGQEATLLPCQFEHGLITLLVPQPCIDTLHFYLDTGGIDALYRSGRRKRCKAVQGARHGHSKKTISPLDSRVPWPTGLELIRTKELDGPWDGMLGRGWFNGGRWKFDYSAGTLAQAPTTDNLFTATVELGKREHPASGSIGALLRIPVVVSSDTVQLLFDTGAQFEDEHGAVHATSFITDSLFNSWHARYPQWPVLRGSDHSTRPASDQIIVPTLTIGDRTIGPVVFTVREKVNFQVLSKHFMDRPVVGALGANALEQLGAFILDYPDAVIRMAAQEKP